MNGRAMFAFVIPLDGTQLPVDPSFGGGMRPPTDPGYGHPGFAPGHPGNALPGQPVDPGFGGGRPGGADPGYGHPGFAPGHPSGGFPVAPVRPSNPIVLPPGMWPPSVPSIPGHPDNSLPPEAANKPIVIPPDPDLGIEQPIVIPPPPQGVALLIALPQGAQPKGGAPGNAKPAILVQAGQKPVLVYVTATASPK